MDSSIMFVALAALILLVVPSLRPGAESRNAFVSQERELAMRGFVWGDGPGRATR
jgi:hypothetical protein